MPVEGREDNPVQRGGGRDREMVAWLAGMICYQHLAVHALLPLLLSVMLEAER